MLALHTSFELVEPLKKDVDLAFQPLGGRLCPVDAMAFCVVAVDGSVPAARDKELSARRLLPAHVIWELAISVQIA